MSPEVLAGTSFPHDILELFRLLHHHDVRYLLVGGEAVIFYGHARLTGEVNVYYDRSQENVERLHVTLVDFWSGEIPGVDDFTELAVDGQIIQFGVPPDCIDLINRIDGVEFGEAWPGRTTAEIDTGAERTPVLYIGLEALVRNKRASGRPKDVDDLQYLLRALERRKL